jgi:hypothetical protein
MFPVSPLRLPVFLTFFNPDAPEETTARVTVTHQTWVTSQSVIVVSFSGTTPDHGPDDAQVENLSAYIENIVPGVGFDVTAYAPNGTWGQYQLACIVIA